jgi:hypothetical protein
MAFQVIAETVAAVEENTVGGELRSGDIPKLLTKFRDLEISESVSPDQEKDASSESSECPITYETLESGYRASENTYAHMRVLSTRSWPDASTFQSSKY